MLARQSPGMNHRYAEMLWLLDMLVRSVLIVTTVVPTAKPGRRARPQVLPSDVIAGKASHSPHESRLDAVPTPRARHETEAPTQWQDSGCQRR